MADPWFKFYPSDWLGGTRALSAAETGVYVTLVAMMYEAGGPVKQDRARLARLCNCPAGAFARILDGLFSAGKLVEKDGGLWNDRVEKELYKREVSSQSASDASRSRWSKERQKPEQNQRSDDASASSPQCGNDARPMLPEARVQIVREEGKPSSWRFEEFWLAWPNKVSKSAAEAAWRKLPEQDREQAFKSVGPWFANWRAQNPQASPMHAATYLNKRRWRDEFQMFGGPNDNRTHNGPSGGRPNRPDPALEQIARLAGLGAAPGNGGR